MKIAVSPEFDILLSQARAASPMRRVIARTVGVFAVLSLAFTLGGLMMGHSFAGSLQWSLAHGAAIAILCVVPLTLTEQALPASGAGALASVLVGVLGWGVALLGATFLFELHHGVAGALHEAGHVVESLRESARPWVLWIGPGSAIGLAGAWRRKITPWTTRFGVGALILLVSVAIIPTATLVGITPPRWFGRLIVLALTLPLAQVTHALLVLIDGLSLGPPPRGTQVDDGPPPLLPVRDRFLCGTHLNPRVDGTLLLVGCAAGVHELGWFAGLLLGLLFWFLLKVTFSLAAVLWPRRLEQKGLIDRAADCHRFKRHGRAREDPIRTDATAELVGLFARTGRLDEADAEMERLRPRLESLDAMRHHNLSTAWIQAGQPARGLELLDSWSKPIPAALRTVWILNRAAALIGVDRAEEALTSLDDVARPRHKVAAALLDNNAAVARLQLDRELPRALEQATAAHGARDIPLTRGTLGAALAASGRNDEAIGLLRPLVDAPAPRAHPIHAAFRYYWLGRAHAESDPEASADLLREAATLEGPWARRAEQAIADRS